MNDLDFLSMLPDPGQDDEPQNDPKKVQKKDAAAKGDNAASQTMEAVAAAVAIAGSGAAQTARVKDSDDDKSRQVANHLWLVSFTDLFSLLLCFFVLMYALKDPDINKIHEILGNKGGGLQAGLHEVHGSGGSDKEVSINRVEYGEAINLDYLSGVLKKSLADAKIQDQVKVTEGRDHLKLTVDTSDALANNGRLAKDLAARLMLLSNRITVVGLEGDWADSLAQATAFAAMLRDGGYRKSFVTLGESGSGGNIEVRVEADDGTVH